MPDKVIILPESVTEPVKALGLTRQDIEALVALEKQAVEVFVKATPTKWDDMVLDFAGEIVFAKLTDIICKALGIP